MNKYIEFQTTVMGLKREHKDILEKKEAEHAVQVFSVRGESAELVDKYVKKIQELETEIEELKTINELQSEVSTIRNDYQRFNVDFDVQYTYTYTRMHVSHYVSHYVLRLIL